MKKIISSVVLFFLIIPVSFAYNLNQQDNALVSKLSPIIKSLYTNDREKFINIKKRLTEKYNSSNEGTRINKILGTLLFDIVSYDIEQDLLGLFEIIDDLEHENDKILVDIIKIIDGDTVTVKERTSGEQYSVRMIGIDAPESSALRFGEAELYGSEATTYLTDLLLNRVTFVEFDASQGLLDTYGRKLAYVFAYDTNINEQMILGGFAKEYTYDKDYKYKDNFIAAQKVAKEKQLNIWKITETSSIDFRSSNGNYVNLDNPTCNIKGNISSKNVKIYHIPGCNSYKKTKISVSKGEQYFCSQEEAVLAGWRIAKNCN